MLIARVPYTLPITLRWSRFPSEVRSRYYLASDGGYCVKLFATGLIKSVDNTRSMSTQRDDGLLNQVKTKKESFIS